MIAMAGYLKIKDGINYSDIADSLIDISESEIVNEYEIAKEERYKNYICRLVDYILFPLPKVDKDSSAYSIELDSIMTQAYLISDEGKYSTSIGSELPG